MKFTDRNGNVKEYTVDGTKPEQLAQGRTAHRWTAWTATTVRRIPSSLRPERAVDIAIANGYLPRTLPFARREAVAALKDEYASGEEAQRGIDARLRKAFASHAKDPALRSHRSPRCRTFTRETSSRR